MPFKFRQSQEDAVISAATQFSGGAPLRALLLQSQLDLDAKTFGRLLGRLVERGLLLREGGRTKGARYRLPGQPSAPAPSPTSPSGQPTFFTRESETIRSSLDRPVSERGPVSYHRDLLDKYIPNKTYYLPDQVRRHLRGLGQTPDEKMAAGTYAKEILQHLIIDLAWNSSRLEGNTYSLLDTKRLLEEGVEATGKAAEEAQMILNHKEAIRFLVEDVENISIDSMTVRNLHSLLSFNLIKDPADRGLIRRGEVFIHGSVFIPLQIPLVIEECFNQMLRTVQVIEDPFEQSIFILIHLPYLQPFHDINKRAARLTSNIPFILHNLRPLSFADVDRTDYTTAHLAVYELERIELMRDIFIFAYERSCKRYEAVRSSLGEPDPFRQKYRALMRQIVRGAVCTSENPTDAVRFITQSANREVPEEDRARFLAMAETGLGAMHDGNFAEFGLRPSEFLAWQARISAEGHPG